MEQTQVHIYTLTNKTIKVLVYQGTRNYLINLPLIIYFYHNVSYTAHIDISQTLIKSGVFVNV